MGRPGLVTVIGRGGVGKTRLVAEAVAAARTLHRDRWWVSMASVSDDALVSSAVAIQLGVSPGSDERDPADRRPAGAAGSVPARGRRLRHGRRRRRVVRLAPARGLSRHDRGRHQPLGARHPGRARPARSAPCRGRPGTRSGPPVRLLTDRVRESGGQLEMTDDLAPYVAALCRRCGGLPLALELVAAQLAELSPGDLVDHLDEVAAEGGDALRHAVEGSYALLDAQESAVLRRLAVLDGGCDLPLIRAVVDDRTVPGSPGGPDPARADRPGAAGRGPDRAAVALPPRRRPSPAVAGPARLVGRDRRAVFERLRGAVLALLPDDPDRRPRRTPTRSPP